MKRRKKRKKYILQEYSYLDIPFTDNANYFSYDPSGQDVFVFRTDKPNETLTYTFYLQSVHGKCFSTTRNKERFLSMTKTIEKLARKAERMQPARWWRVATYHGLEFPPDSPKRMIFEISHFSYNTAVVINRGNNGGEREKKQNKKKEVMESFE